MTAAEIIARTCGLNACSTAIKKIVRITGISDPCTKKPDK